MKVLVGISGGVDSATSCVVLKEMGYEVGGCYINFIDKERCANEDAKSVCNNLGIPFEFVDLYDDFKVKIIDNFVNCYKVGKTPNPCILCNQYFKFGTLLDYALNHGYDYIATGHYAKIEYSEKYGRNIIRKANNLKKDQSYFLYRIPARALPHIIFPLEDCDSKEDVRKIARDNNMEVASKKDSLDVCFILNKDYKEFLLLNKYVEEKDGNIVFTDGRILGRHQGLFRYTIGQRKGLGIAFEEPLYVVGFNHQKNELIVGVEKNLYKDEMYLEDVNLLLFDSILDGTKLNVRLRYQGKDVPCRVYNTADGLKVVFDEPQKSPTRGQSAVFYIDDILVGGGFIK